MPNNNPQQTTPQQQIARAAEGATKAATRLGEGAEHATSVAIEKVRQVRDEAQSGIEHQRAEVADRIRRLGGVLRASSETLSTDDPLAQQLFASAGDRIEQVAEYIGNLTPSDLANDITSLARRRPGLFFGGSFILGLALGRFVKSSASTAGLGSDEQDEEYEDTLAVRPAGRRGRGQGRTGSGAEAQASAATRVASTPASSASSTSVSAGSSSGSPATPAGSAGSHSTGTVGSGSAHGASPSPSYGAASSATTASRPPQSSSSTPATSTPRDLERGEGSKS